MVWKRARNIRRVRSDNEIAADVWAALEREPTLHARTLNNLALVVTRGTVTLFGHVDRSKQRIEDVVCSVRDVRHVNNRLVEDYELRIEVSEALARDPRTSALPVRVGCVHGWIRVYGDLATEAEREAVEEVAGQHPDVRGVVILPEWGTQPVSDNPDPVQPDIGSTAYTSEGTAGKVTRVVIHPRNRLVSHLVLITNYHSGRRLERAEFVVPAKDIEQVTIGGVFLKDAVPDVTTYPRFAETDFPAAPENWQPPFPYRAEHVRWSRTALARKTDRSPAAGQRATGRGRAFGQRIYGCPGRRRMRCRSA